MTEPPSVITDNDTLFTHYHLLRPGSIVCTRVRLRPGEEHLLTDLVERGVTLIPSATAQLASRSKVFQARLFADCMVADTVPVYDSHDLLGATSALAGYSRILLKKDNKNAGLGLHVFDSIEQLYNHVSGGRPAFPFVVQPYLAGARDVRVIVLAEYVEAYERINKGNFRKNMHCGGTAVPHEISAEEYGLCRSAMARGGFPYAHVDLLVTDDQRVFLQEINLRGGLKGARITPGDYRTRVEAIHRRLLRQEAPRAKQESAEPRP